MDNIIDSLWVRVLVLYRQECWHAVCMYSGALAWCWRGETEMDANWQAGENVWVVDAGFTFIVVWAKFPISESEAMRACAIREVEGIRLFPQGSESKAHELAALLAS